MSVLIKGMKKPKDCYSCPFAHNGWPDEWEMHCLFLDRQVGYFGKKLKVPKDCPLVEVSDPCAQSEQRWIPCRLAYLFRLWREVFNNRSKQRKVLPKLWSEDGI